MLTIRPATAQEKGLSYAKAQAFLIVERNGVAVGFIVKHKNTASDIHPWKVFSVGTLSSPSSLLRCFYTDADALKIGPDFDGVTGGRVSAEAFARRHFA